MKSILFLCVLISTLLYSLSDARQGCCSHHGGVCDCACCDGTPLSAKCAPYYDCSETKSDEAEQESDDTVYFNRKSLKYHCPSCEWAIQCTENCVSVSLEEAKDAGGIPCKVCGGKCK